MTGFVNDRSRETEPLAPGNRDKPRIGAVGCRESDLGPGPTASLARNVTGGNLRLNAESRIWRRRLGPLAWAVLEDLALTAHNTDQGWVAPIGVRDIAASIGVTKDTAARAVAALGTAGLAVLQRVEGRDGRLRSGYRLQLPAGISLRPCPDDVHRAVVTPSAGCPEAEDTDSPRGQDSDAPQPGRSGRQPPEREFGRERGGAGERPGLSVEKRQPIRTEVAIQPRLFAPPLSPTDDPTQ